MQNISKETFSFLNDLKLNNNREWFENNKSRFIDIQKEIKLFSSTAIGELNKHDNIESSKIFRIYRDVRFSKNKTPFKCIIKGDTKYMNIAAASVLAKTSRDELMLSLSKKYPLYEWNKNKGYPTKFHRKAISKYGITKHHRKSFKLL